MPKIFAVSDGSGTTADMVARAALAQFDIQVDFEKLPQIRTTDQIMEIVGNAAQNDGIIIHTLVSEELRLAMFNAGREYNVATVDLMGPLLARLSKELSASPRSEPGVFNPFDAGYIERIEALEYAVRHDEGHHRSDLDKADIVLLGVSRAAKTPLSIYLAYRGWKVANIPLVLGIDPPDSIFALPKNRVIGLKVSTERMKEIRRFGEDHPGISPIYYADSDYINKESKFADKIFKQGEWYVLDVSHKSIEEAASEIITLVRKK
jgi:regulator of PEP synthase PpsR (kinase-PPPase family)